MSPTSRPTGYIQKGIWAKSASAKSGLSQSDVYQDMVWLTYLSFVAVGADANNLGFVVRSDDQGSTYNRGQNFPGVLLAIQSETYSEGNYLFVSTRY
jgi:hypothetical protein